MATMSTIGQVEDHSRFVMLGTQRVHYWTSNEAAERTIVMLHGFRSSHAGLRKLADKFPDHRLIIPDFPGYGLTDELPHEHTVDSYAQFIKDFIDKLELHDFSLMGHSFGALVGLIYAADHPQHVKALVMVSPVPKPNLVSKAGSLYYLIGRALPAPLNQHWLTARRLHRPVRQLVVRTHDPLTHAEVMREGERELEQLRPHINVENYLSLIRINPTIWLERLSVPTLVIAGDSDRLTRLSDIVETYERDGINIQVIAGMGHFAPAEIPQAISATVQAWLSQYQPHLKKGVHAE